MLQGLNLKYSGIYCIPLLEYRSEGDLHPHIFSEIEKFATRDNVLIESFFKKSSHNSDGLNDTRTFVIVTADVESNKPVFDPDSHRLLGFFSLSIFSMSQKICDSGSSENSNLKKLPTIEVVHLAANDVYKSEYKGIGELVYTGFIRDIICEMSKYLGVSYISIFAARGNEKPLSRLVSYYEGLGFESVDEFKPTIDFEQDYYTDGCKLLIQRI